MPEPPGPLPVLLVFRDGPFRDWLVAELDREAFRAQVLEGLDDPVVRGALSCDILVVDRTCDPGSGWREVRAATAAAVLLVGGDGPEDVVEQLTAGADDVLVRTDREHELVARVRALARRRVDPFRRSGHEVVVGGVVLDRARHQVLVRDQPIELPLKQFQLLDLLLSNAGRVLHRERILRILWGERVADESNTLEVQVRRLRQAIEVDPRKPELVRTVRGIGYRFEGQPGRT